MAVPAKESRKTWRRLIAYCRSHMLTIAAALLLSLIGSLLEVNAPGQLRIITDEIKKGLSGPLDLDSVFCPAGTVALLFVGSWLFSTITNGMMATITARISNSLRTDIAQKINRLPLSYFDRVSLGDVISRVTNDVDTIGQTLNQNIGLLVQAGTLFMGALILMFASDWILSLTVIAASLLGFALSRGILKRSQKHFKARQQQLGAINGHIEEVYSGHAVVKVYNGEKAAW